MVTKGSRSRHNTSASQGSEKKAAFMSAPHDRNLARTPEVWDKIRLRRGCWLNKKESKSRLALAARKWAVGAIFISPSSLIKAPLCSSPSQPSLPVYPQPTYFKGAEDTAITLSVLFNHQMSSDILSSTCGEQTSGSNELFRLLSLSGGVAGCFFFIILTLFFFINWANWNISGFKINNESNANALTLEEVERMSHTLTETVKNCPLLFRATFL